MKLQPFAKGTLLYQLISNLAWVIKLWRSPTLIKLVGGRMSGRDATWGQHIRVLWLFVCFFFVFIFFNKATAHTGEPILVHNISKDVVWCKEDPFRDEKCVILKFGGVLPQNTTNIGRNGQLPAKNQMSNNSETVRDAQNMSMNNDYETGVALSDSVNKTCVNCPLAEKSRWRHFRLAIKPRNLGNHAF